MQQLGVELPFTARQLKLQAAAMWAPEGGRYAQSRFSDDTSVWLIFVGGYIAWLR